MLSVLKRYTAGKEQPTGTCRRPAPGQVAGQGLADVGRQREPVLAACLPPDDELTRPPVDVPQFQP
jgi:hypothetical protein